MKSFYWHDYETWGANPAVDRPSQFAGVRTDEDLNIISDPLVIYCQPPEDIWPHPEACLVTGITPQQAQKEGLSEQAFIASIHAQLAQPQTCGVGYNSIRFDDEVTRYTLFRNFYDPYEREWRNGNSRWDIIDMVRLTYALRPQGIEWPMVDERPSFRLENLTAANGISHQSAHDAYSDVEATIAMARLIRDTQPELYNYVLSHKSKQQVAQQFDFHNRKPLLHISSRFSAAHGCAALVVPLALHPVNRNAAIVYDLSVDPTPLINLDVEAIRERLYTAAADLPDGVERIPLKLVHFNRSPVLLTPKMLSEEVAQRIQINKQRCENHWHTLLQHDLGEKLKQLYSTDNFAPRSDPEQKLYDGFLSDTDKKRSQQLRRASEASLRDTHFIFEDERLNAMVLRYKARNFAHLLSAEEREEWQEFVRHRLVSGDEGCLDAAAFITRVRELMAEHQGDGKKLAVLASLEDYHQQKMAALQAF